MSLNNGYTYRHQAAARAASPTLLEYLAATWRHSTPDDWADRITRGEVELDGVVAHAALVVRTGQQIVWHRQPWDEPDVPLHFEVLYEDAALVAVSKPSGLPTLPAGGFLAHTLATLVRSRYPGARPMHRLGRCTSGVIVFARSTEAASVLARAFRERSVRKRYRALGLGVAALDRYVIDAPIGPVAHPLLGSVHAQSRIGKPSHSVATVIDRRSSSTLFQVDITTGRPHQIRIHLASVGHPLVGDPLYEVGGLPRSGSCALPGDGGYLLHAERLEFAHPVSGTLMTVSAEAPEELRSSTVDCQEPTAGAK